MGSISKRTLAVLFFIKIITGFFVWWIYTHHYESGDMITFFMDGDRLYHFFWNDIQVFKDIVFNGDPRELLDTWISPYESFLFNDSRIVVLYNFLLRHISSGSIFVHIIFSCFISFVGMVALYRAGLKHLQADGSGWWLLLFFIPSVLFWTSGIFKESLLIGALGLFLYFTDFGLRTNYSKGNFFFILFLVIFLLLIKFYVLLSFLPGYIVNIWQRITYSKNILIRYLIVYTIYLMLFILPGFFKPSYNIFEYIKEKQQKAIGVANGGVFLLGKNHFIRIDYYKKEIYLQPTATSSVYFIAPNAVYEGWELGYKNDIPFIKDKDDLQSFVGKGDLLEYKLLYEVIPSNSALKPVMMDSNVISFILNSPFAFWQTLSIPDIQKQSPYLQTLAATENIIYVLLFFIGVFFAIFRYKQIHHLHMILFCYSFIFILFVLIGYTIPIAGAIVRYKVPALPFLMFVFISVFHPKKFLCIFKKQ
ncbi:MAG: hypothetical protein IT234_00225 [Bacteroidia bacterium]|nr:hypothetical protein [Bacteroidia bacterium]